MIRHHNIVFSNKPQHSFPVFFGQPAGHGLVCTDENHAIIIFRDHGRRPPERPSATTLDPRWRHWKTLRGIQSKAEERCYQPQQPTLSRSSSANSTFVPQTFQQPQQPAPAAREYILTIPETPMPASRVIQPAQQIQMATKGQQQPRGKPTSNVSDALDSLRNYSQ